MPPFSSSGRQGTFQFLQIVSDFKIRFYLSYGDEVLFNPTAHLMHLPSKNFNIQIKEQKSVSFVLLLSTISRHYYFFFVSCHFLSVRNMLSTFICFG